MEWRIPRELQGLTTIQTRNGDDALLLAERYIIIRKLGEGGMGVVYLAEDRELANEKVAVKFLPPILANNERALHNLKKEATTARQLSHPNIIRLHDLQSDGSQKFLIMEYIDGQTLEQLFAEKENDRFTTEEILPIAAQIGEGLEYAHSCKVLHRDLKPSNIMIDSQGKVKLLDFGIAREMKDSYTRISGKETSGTLPYMSPQQMMGDHPTTSMDIYSFAAVLYECLCGHPPFFRGDIREQIRSKIPEKLPGVSTAFNNAIMAALSKNPANRPASPLKFVGMLKREIKTESDLYSLQRNEIADRAVFLKIIKKTILQSLSIRKTRVLTNRLKIILAILLVIFAAVFNIYQFRDNIFPPVKIYNLLTPLISTIKMNLSRESALHPIPTTDLNISDEVPTQVSVTEPETNSLTGIADQYDLSLPSPVPSIIPEMQVDNGISATTNQINDTGQIEIEQDQEISILINDLKQKARDAFDNNQLTSPENGNVMEYINRIEKIDPKNPFIVEMRMRVAESYEKWGDKDFEIANYNRSRYYYQKVLDIDPNNFAMQKKLSKCIDAQRNIPGNISSDTLFDPESSSYYKNKSDKTRTQTTTYDKNQAATYFKNGVAAYSKGDYNNAINNFTRTINLHPYYPDVYNKRGEAYRKSGKLTDAIRDYSRAIQINPNDIEAYISRGVALYLSKETDLAIEDFDKAIALNPRHGRAWYNKGMALKSLNLTGKAIDAMQEAFRLGFTPAKKELEILSVQGY
ncbi:MAG: hypothetical protein A2161_06270 [Candidatus Schekmanbacteria bacterium RBG_13_48_7]|uniref:non-specific serine/threonine protein kinase n=1 Tax=Candidatus Schekmanbacteria bacterium RBG_13_48_7 TaxID=1817878 RepID=A0A1F7RVF9_9BACT|nr:MAG: hypothetical protein A2161_06270 [Candidatus Schekmanbacteria bacterium RBG_13_48_7]